MKAMILAAGFGKRMLPLTETTPKPLLQAGGRALLEYHIINLQAAGFRELVVNAAHLGDQIETFCGDGSRWGLTIIVSREGEPLETAGGIGKALPLLGDAPFLVVNGDIWCPFPFHTLRQLTPRENGAHLVLVPNPPHNSGGDFGLDGDRVVASGARPLTFAGIAVYQPGFFAGLPSGRAPLKPLLDDAIAMDRVSGERYGGAWVDVGTPERLTALDQDLVGQIQ